MAPSGGKGIYRWLHRDFSIFSRQQPTQSWLSCSGSITICCPWASYDDDAWTVVLFSNYQWGHRLLLKPVVLYRQPPPAPSPTSPSLLLLLLYTNQTHTHTHSLTFLVWPKRTDTPLSSFCVDAPKFYRGYGQRGIPACIFAFVTATPKIAINEEKNSFGSDTHDLGKSVDTKSLLFGNNLVRTLFYK